MILDSNLKAYNLDKMLEFLFSERSVFMFISSANYQVKSAFYYF